MKILFPWFILMKLYDAPQTAYKKQIANFARHSLQRKDPEMETFSPG